MRIACYALILICLCQIVSCNAMDDDKTYNISIRNESGRIISKASIKINETEIMPFWGMGVDDEVILLDYTLPLYKGLRVTWAYEDGGIYTAGYTGFLRSDPREDQSKLCIVIQEDNTLKLGWSINYLDDLDMIVELPGVLVD